MRDGPLAGLVLIDTILARGDLGNSHLAHAAQGGSSAGGSAHRWRPEPPTDEPSSHAAGTRAAIS